LQNSQSKVLFITGFVENATIGNGHLDPGMSIITKPFVSSAFANRVRLLIDDKDLASNRCRPETRLEAADCVLSGAGA
jgi:hypothetical protein